MKHLAPRTTVVSIAVLGMSAVAGPAFATHPHVLDTPGTCVTKAGAGFGTGEVHDPYTGPTFHSQVHKGTPGLIAFELENNPVEVKGLTDPDAPLACP